MQRLTASRFPKSTSPNIWLWFVYAVPPPDLKLSVRYTGDASLPKMDAAGVTKGGLPFLAVDLSRQLGIKVGVTNCSPEKDVKRGGSSDQDERELCKRTAEDRDALARPSPQQRHEAVYLVVGGVISSLVELSTPSSRTTGDLLSKVQKAIPLESVLNVNRPGSVAAQLLPQGWGSGTAFLLLTADLEPPPAWIAALQVKLGGGADDSKKGKVGISRGKTLTMGKEFKVKRYPVLVCVEREKGGGGGEDSPGYVHKGSYPQEEEMNFEKVGRWVAEMMGEDKRNKAKK